MDLCYVPPREFSRVRALEAPAESVASLFATLCRINVLYMVKNAGSGHIGTSFSCADIVSWLFLNTLRSPGSEGAAGPSDCYFSSKGHDAPTLYAVLTGLGLLDFDLIHRFRRLGGLPGHPDVSVPHMVTNTGSLGMGISKAKGMAFARRRKGQEGHIYVLTGDGELQEGQIWESLQSAANQGLGEITAIVDHNKVQSDLRVSETSDLGSLEDKFRAFGWQVDRCDGHDIKAFAAVLQRQQAATGIPKVIIADTVKGCGVGFMSHTAMKPGELYRYHSGAPTDDAYAAALRELAATADRMLATLGAGPLAVESRPYSPRPAQPGQRLADAYSAELVRQGELNPRVTVLDADLALDCGLLPFKARFPGRFVECGIAEQDMVSQAGGMALQGLLPIVHSFACFLAPRANEQIYNNATERTRIIYAGFLAGLIPGGPGHSHQSVRDIDILQGVPGLTLMEPSCPEEVAMALDYAINRSTESVYLRMASIPVHVPYRLPAGWRLEPGRGATLLPGKDAVLFAYGPVMLTEAWNAAGMLAAMGVELKVVNLPWLNRVDSQWLSECVRGCRWVFTLDNHYIEGGQGQLLLARLAALALNPSPSAASFGVREVPACGANDEVLKAHALDAASLAEAIHELMTVRK